MKTGPTGKWWKSLWWRSSEAGEKEWERRDACAITIPGSCNAQHPMQVSTHRAADDKFKDALQNGLVKWRKRQVDVFLNKLSKFTKNDR